MYPKLTVVLVTLLLVPATALGAAHKGRSLHASLRGASEVPKGDPNGSGTAEVKINGTQVCWELTTARIGTPTAAHIHKAPPGKAGPVVVAFGTAYSHKGCATASAAVASAIQRNPSAYYVNVHNAAYSGGAVRGQLRSDD
ncbi:MAG TPA: CHRD domain-containing protein [Gaiellaceae bacterium]